jgi:catechol 2,3-dioxygenase-like lactoylglutathione lyase family enzyme
MSFGRTTPILRIFDEAKAKEFYVGFLGFKIDWEHRFEEGLPLYLQVSKDGCVLHLSEHHGDGAPGAAMRIETNELEEFHRQLLAKQYKYARPGIEDTPWHSKEMSIADPFGNRLTFTSAIST